MLLRNILGLLVISETGLSPPMAQFSNCLSYHLKSHIGVLQPRQDKSYRFGLFPFRSPLLRESHSLSFPLLTEMFHFSRFAIITYVFSNNWLELIQSGFPIRKSPGQSMFATHRGLSQLTTSFIAWYHQGIHLLLLLDLVINYLYPFKSIS